MKRPDWRRLAPDRIPALVGGLLTSVATTLPPWRKLRARAAMQEAVAAREREMSLILSGLQELVFRCDAEGRLSFVNAAWERLTGRPASDWIGRPFADAVVADRRSDARRLLLPLPADGKTRSGSLAFRSASGEAVPHECIATPLPDGEGFVGSAVDLTERLQVRGRLQSQLSFT
ncbi:MAG: PAS domain-containing protein [Rubrivivax sp.]